MEIQYQFKSTDINQTNTHNHQTWPSENTLHQLVCKYKLFTGHSGTFTRNIEKIGQVKGNICDSFWVLRKIHFILTPVAPAENKIHTMCFLPRASSSDRQAPPPPLCLPPPAHSAARDGTVELSLTGRCSLVIGAAPLPVAVAWCCHDIFSCVTSQTTQ